MGRFRSRKGESPLTRVRDLYEAIEVSVMLTPPDNAAQAIWEFERATWHDRPDQTKVPDDLHILDEILSKGALWQAQEILPFMVCINNVTRVETHQLVRQRIGITFSQQCSSDSDWRHHDVLVPRGMARTDAVHQFTMAAITQKNVYADLINRGQPVREARYILPHCLATFLYIYAPAITLAGMYRRRICPMVHSWEMVIVMEKLREAIIAAAPYMDQLLVNPCKTGNCWYNKADPDCQTNMYCPDEDHGGEPADARATYEMGRLDPRGAGGDHLLPLKDKYFIGLTSVEKDKWQTMGRKYGV